MHLAAVLDSFEVTLGHLAPGTQKNKRAIIAKLRATYFGIDALPLRHVRPSDVAGWLARHCAGGSAAYYNDALSTIRWPQSEAHDTSAPAKLQSLRCHSFPNIEVPEGEIVALFVAQLSRRHFELPLGGSATGSRIKSPPLWENQPCSIAGCRQPSYNT